MILVTGGAGYIGGICAERLLEQGREVCVLDNLDRGYRDVIPDKAAFVETDLADRDALERVFRDYPIRAVMHFAAYALVGESMREPNLYFRNNFVNALNLLEAAQRAGVERFIFSSTCAIFGDKVAPPIGEDAPKNPINPYGESKLCFERALEWNLRLHGLPYFALRYFNACGATATRGERHEPETHLIPLVLDVAAGRREHVRILGDDYPTPDGTCIRDYVHVLDLADAHIAALEAPGELSGGYNVGSGRGDSVREVVDTARRVTGREIPVVIAPRRPGDPPELVADPYKIQTNLGWKPSLTLEDAIRSAWAHHQRQA
ncbi:MAG: UDP-glucose 4-epimerase GalE [Acidobacteria bacterium]|nr:UDP-glucose 4-epimerase GalE [Acidobacteriota bacterium]